MISKYLSLISLAPSLALAANSETGVPVVSVENATFHQLVFANDDVAVLNNLYPARSDSGFHMHPRELFYVVVAAARASTQKPGHPLRTPPMAPVGAVGFNVMTSEPFVHRVVNNDSRPYHVIAVELRRAGPLGTPISVREPDTGYEQIFDNNRLRAWRLVLKPGGSTIASSQMANGVRIVVRGGLLLTSRPQIPDQTLAIENGDFAFQVAGGTRTLRNTGKSTIELVELELK